MAKRKLKRTEPEVTFHTRFFFPSHRFLLIAAKSVHDFPLFPTHSISRTFTLQVLTSICL